MNGPAIPLEQDMADLDGRQHAAESFARLAIELHDSPSIDETIDTVVQFALQALNCSAAGIALAGRDRPPEIAAVTDPMVEAVYRTQLETGEGPLMTALARQSTVLIRDTTTDDRWPRWAAMVTKEGVRSVLDVPLATSNGSRTVGVLGLYSGTPDAFDADDEAIAHILARHASVAVATALHEENMAQAVDARKLVGQAMGILMERFDLDGDRAFAILQRYSQHNNIKLRDVAQFLIDTRKLPEYRKQD